MSKRARRNHSAAFKTKIALVEFVGDKILIKLSEHFVSLRKADYPVEGMVVVMRQ